MKRGRKIVFTRELSQSQLELAARLGLEPQIEPAISVRHTGDPGRARRRLDDYDAEAWVFTSRNGVEGYAQLRLAGLDVRPPARIYAVGGKTAECLREKGLEALRPGQEDANGLAELIAGDLHVSGRKKTAGGRDHERMPGGDSGHSRPEPHTTPPAGRAGGDPVVIHWCGNRSREELGTSLARGGVRLVRIVVYETTLNAMKPVAGDAEALVFCSPSAVDAYRKSGGFSGRIPELFAIGNTTGELLSLESGEHVHIPSRPYVEDLLKLVAGVLKTGDRMNAS